jgi:hypothetical protein
VCIGLSYTDKLSKVVLLEGKLFVPSRTNYFNSDELYCMKLRVGTVVNISVSLQECISAIRSDASLAKWALPFIA